jgi:D-alanyl-D-alanine carboxypeptidase
MKRQLCLYAVILLVATSISFAQGASSLSADDQKKIDEIATQTLASMGAPSASIAVVKNGQLVYAHAYGYANVDEKTPALPEMQYCIGSISKQFTATAILMLAEQGKLSLDDPVSKFVPNLTRGNEVTIREILSMTSGYQDFWPQDYVMPGMMKSTTPQQILDGWARIPLDFDPGTKWQYSNTNYVIAGLIVEKASGMPLLDFLKKRVFTPLHMESAESMHLAKDDPKDPVGYLRYALGPPRPAPKEGKGWMFAAGELAMTASDLARWDIGVIEQKLMKPASYREMQTEVRLKNGVGTRYGLGVGVAMQNEHHVVTHNGEVSGFVADNAIYPEDRAAIVVLTNLDASGAAGQIADKIRPLLFAAQDEKKEERLQLARKVFADLQQGKIERSLFTSNCNSYFDDQALKDFADSLGPLGPPEQFEQARNALRGGMDYRAYSLRFKNGKRVRITVFNMQDGRIEQFQIAAVE